MSERAKSQAEPNSFPAGSSRSQLEAIQSDPVQGKTIAEIFWQRLECSPTARALVWFDQSGQRYDWNWQELAQQVFGFCQHLKNHNVVAGDHVVLNSENRVEWILADLAMQLLGVVNVPLHSQLSSSQTVQLVEHCAPKLICVSTDQQLAKVSGLGIPLIEFDSLDLQPLSDPVVVDGLKKEASSIGELDLMTILYTSGTTGEPKGVMLSQRNVVSNVYAKLATLPLTEQDLRIGLLPLSHIFARVCDLYTWIASGCLTVLSRGWDSLWDELIEFRPSYLNAVPYFFDKCWRILESDGQLDKPDALSKMLGGRTRILNCGGAPLADHVFDYFDRHQVGLVTGYGLTETSPVATSSRLGNCLKGSVGSAIPGVEIKLADDNEVLIRGDNVMLGYYKDPAATAQAFHDDWFKTGDIGRIDEQGNLFIVGRKKELIVTNGGKNIAPIPIENAITEHPDIEQCVVFGDRQNFLVALIVLADPARRKYQQGQLDLKSIVDRQTREFSRDQQIGRLLVVDEPFSIDNGMLTPKKSMRRTEIFSRYQDAIAGLYSAQTNNSRDSVSAD